MHHIFYHEMNLYKFQTIKDSKYYQTRSVCVCVCLSVCLSVCVYLCVCNLENSAVATGLEKASFHSNFKGG